MKLLSFLVATQGSVSAGNGTPCNPDSATWKDVHGSTCAKYKGGWCTANGEKGPNWKQFGMDDWTFTDYAKDGHNALSCPECGCGEIAEEPVLTGNGTPCNPDFATWKDVHGSTCAKYKGGWCTANGEKGPAWKLFGMDDWTFTDYAKDGHNALSCPECGCGPSPSTESTNPTDDLEVIKADFTTAFENAFSDPKNLFNKNNNAITLNIANRAKRMFSKFNCDASRKKRAISEIRNIRSTGEARCDAITEQMNNVHTWIKDNLFPCTTVKSKITASLEKKITKQIAKVTRLCPRKISV